MERWSGRVAVVTGASAGIGAAIALELARKGMRVAGLARRAHKVQELSASLEGASGQLHGVACDLTKEDDILAAFDWVNGNLGGVDVLVNNAGVLHLGLLSRSSPDTWREMLNVNVLALSICTREALKSMKNTKVDEGHIIHINSKAGHNPSPQPEGSMYTATKHAVTVLAEGLRQELVQNGSKIKVTSLSPGVVHTDMVSKYGAMKALEPRDLVACVVFTLSSPAHVQIHEIMLRAVPESRLNVGGLQPNLPEEFQQESPPESTQDITPENPPHHQPESPPEQLSVKQPASPSEPLPCNPPEHKPENSPEQQPENPPNPQTAPAPGNTPDNKQENPEPGQPEKQPGHSQNPPESQPENSVEPLHEP